MVYYLSGRAPFSVALSLQGGEAVDGDTDSISADMEFWIGVEDFWVRKITYLVQEIDPQTGNPGTLRTTITYSNFEKPMDIQPPPEAEVTPFPS